MRLLIFGFVVMSIRAKFPVVWLMMWQPAQPTLRNACSPPLSDVTDGVALVDDVVDVVDIVEVDAAAGRTEAIWTVDAVVVEVVEVVDAVLVDANKSVSGTTGVGGASRLMYNAKLVMSGLLSDTVLTLLIASTVLTVSSGRALGAHCALAIVVDGGAKLRLSGNSWLVTPSSTL